MSSDLHMSVQLVHTLLHICTHPAVLAHESVQPRFSTEEGLVFCYDASCVHLSQEKGEDSLNTHRMNQSNFPGFPFIVSKVSQLPLSLTRHFRQMATNSMFSLVTLLSLLSYCLEFQGLTLPISCPDGLCGPSIQRSLWYLSCTTGIHV